MEKLKGLVYFYVTNNDIKGIPTLSLDHKLRVTDILPVFYQYYVTEVPSLFLLLHVNAAVVEFSLTFFKAQMRIIG